MEFLDYDVKFETPLSKNSNQNASKVAWSAENHSQNISKVLKPVGSELGAGGDNDTKKENDDELSTEKSPLMDGPGSFNLNFYSKRF